ncbi:MAG: hypothetical protein A3G23_10430 [Bacteroidetes bacterium RIFCSPLOWO2_12_FULL_37_12]|nr:MAG: hypothetical protein A3G23_10430 [Bacteroidetes bacterium RIFCSPLOWO2_12_FULL_37_12]
MKKYLLFICFSLLLISAQTFATHIIGGNINLRNEGNGNFWLELRLYFDCINGNPGAKDQQVNVSIFEKNSNSFRETFILSLIEENKLNFDDLLCNSGEACVTEMIYGESIYLNPNQYSSAGGYYLSWERCCRNHIIKNIDKPGEVGMTFYLEIPPVNSVNSSPVFKSGAGEYLCTNSQFTYNFGATDADGDQLSYSLIAPIAGNSSQNDVSPPGLPAPYDPVTWSSGYGLNNIMDGSPDLQLDPVTGQISVTPTETGTYVFAIKCEEFRNGTLIGNAIFEYQLTVVNCTGEPPVIGMDNISTTDTVVFAAGKENCIKVFANDVDVDDKLTLTGTGIGFNMAEAGGVFNPVSKIITSPQDTLSNLFCFTPNCTLIPGTIYTIEFSTFDNSCPAPQYDNTLLRFYIKKKSNNAPQLFSLGLTNGDTIAMSAKNKKCVHLFGTDPDPADSLSLGFIFPDNPPLKDSSELIIKTSQSGFIEADFCLTPTCDDANNSPHPIQFILTDNTGSCPLGIDTLAFFIDVKTSGLLEPEIYLLNENPSSVNNLFTVNARNPVSFTVVGKDLTNDSLIFLGVTALNFSFESTPVIFNEQTGVGTQGPVASVFSWTPQCEHARDSFYRMNFYLSSLNKNVCMQTGGVTLPVNIKVNPLPPFPAVTPSCLERGGDNVIHVLWSDTLDENSIEKYYIHRKTNGNPFQVIDSVAGNMDFYDDSQAYGSDTIEYCYKISTLNKCNANGVSSGEQCSIREPVAPNLKNATVIPNSHTLITWNPTSDNSFTHVEIFRKYRNEPETSYNLVASVRSRDTTNWEDWNVNPLNFSYCYKVRANNTCGTPGILSNNSCTVLLKGKNGIFENNLEWNDYYYWKNGVNRYVLYRSHDFQGPYEPVEEFNPDKLDFKDENLEREYGLFFYKVLAYENGSDSLISSSNVIELPQRPFVFAPNAFTPDGDGINDVFEIKNSFVKEYWLQIFDRWGLLIYETHNPFEFWDGTYKGKKVMMDAYAYLVRASGYTGLKISRSGTVTVLR